MSFLQIWERVTAETDIKKLNELADLVGTTQQYVSRKKSKNEFSVEWAYKIAQKYDLLTEWLMTGKGPKRLSDEKSEVLSHPILLEIDEWLAGLVVEKPEATSWFTFEFESKFPMFSEWKKRKRAEDGRNTTTPTNNVA